MLLLSLIKVYLSNCYLLNLINWHLPGIYNLRNVPAYVSQAEGGTVAAL